jgi:lipoprotein-anchoring transpeptidase ErfK/SrfK
MRLFAFLRQLSAMLAVPLLGLAFVSPVNAQTSSASEAPSTAQSESASAPTSDNPATAKDDSGGSNAAAATTESNSSAAPNESQPNGAKPASNPATEKTGSDVLITIDKSSQRMAVLIDGIKKYTWPVSTGRSGYATPSGSYKPFRLESDHYSKEWDDAPMPHSIFFTEKGHAIHGSHETKRLGTPASHGCVRLAPKNAATLYALVESEGLENIKVVVSGGGKEVARQHAKRRQKEKTTKKKERTPQYGQADPGRFKPGYGQPQRRCGLFGRRRCGGAY